VTRPKLLRRKTVFNKRKQNFIYFFVLQSGTADVIYNKCKQNTMSSTSVYSIRIDTRVRKMIEEMSDLNCQEEIRALIEQSVKTKRKAYLLSKARENQHRLITGMTAEQAIREDRDAR